MRHILEWVAPANGYFGAGSVTGGPHGRVRLIFVLGSQRSGTNVLRQSLSLGPYVRGFNERECDELHKHWKLRPEPEIRQFLAAQRGTVLLKPIKSVIDRPLREFVGGFPGYRLHVAWIYRDPVRVFASRRARWLRLANIDEFCAEWNRVNAGALDMVGDQRVAIVRYADLIADRTVFERLCSLLKVRGEYLFLPDRSRAYEELAATEIERIVTGTADTVSRLDAARRFTPSQLPTRSAPRAAAPLLRAASTIASGVISGGRCLTRAARK